MESTGVPDLTITWATEYYRFFHPKGRRPTWVGNPNGSLNRLLPFCNRCDLLNDARFSQGVKPSFHQQLVLPSLKAFHQFWISGCVVYISKLWTSDRARHSRIKEIPRILHKFYCTLHHNLESKVISGKSNRYRGSPDYRICGRSFVFHISRSLLVIRANWTSAFILIFPFEPNLWLPYVHQLSSHSDRRISWQAEMPSKGLLWIKFQYSPL